MNKTEKSVAFFLLLFPLLFLPPVFCGENWFERGLSSLRSQQYEVAIEAFSRAIELNPNSVEAYNNRGISWYKKGDYDRALSDYSKALEIAPRCAEAYNNRGALWFYKGNYNQAISDYDRALGIDPEFAEAYSNRGAAWFCKGNQELAIADYNRALKINANSAETNKQLAWILSAGPMNNNRSGSQLTAVTQKDIRLKQESAPGAAGAVPSAQGKKRNSGKIGKKEDAVLSKTARPRGKRGKCLKQPHPEETTPCGETTKPDRADALQAAFCIQVGAFFSRQKAKELTMLLKQKGYAARVLPFQTWSKKRLYAVRIGPYHSRREAGEKAAEISAREGMPTIVRRADEL